jgi:hypothetical protein
MSSASVFRALVPADYEFYGHYESLPLDDDELIYMIMDQNKAYLSWVPEREQVFWRRLLWARDINYNYQNIESSRKQLNCELYKSLYHPASGDLNCELQEYLYHPSRIQRWLDAGNDIEDYLN